LSIDRGKDGERECGREGGRKGRRERMTAHQQRRDVPEIETIGESRGKEEREGRRKL
jgi:hypothetical protein